MTARGGEVMEAMTLQDVREAIALKLVRGRDAGQASLKEWHAVLVAHLHPERATDAHLAQPAQAVDVDYVPGELDRTAPERVWLQIDTSASNNVRNEVWPGADGVTWQDESIGGLEIQYVRADLVPRALCGEKAGPVGDGKYRLLGPGDVIEPDDEFIADNAVDWVPLKANPGTAQLFAGMQYRLGTLKQARRPLPASPTPDKEGQP